MLTIPRLNSIYPYPCSAEMSVQLSFKSLGTRLVIVLYYDHEQLSGCLYFHRTFVTFKRNERLPAYLKINNTNSGI